MTIFFFNDTATTEIYTLSLHDALPICFFGRDASLASSAWPSSHHPSRVAARSNPAARRTCSSIPARTADLSQRDRKSTRLNSSHGYISYAVFCLKKKKDLVVTSHTRNL